MSMFTTNKEISAIQLLETAYIKGQVSRDEFFKALDTSNLVKKKITDKNGKTTTKWVKRGEAEGVENSKPKEQEQGEKTTKQKVEKKPKKLTEQDLAKFAKQTSDEDLERHSKGADEKMRIAAKKELENRETEHHKVETEDKNFLEKVDIQKIVKELEYEKLLLKMEEIFKNGEYVNVKTSFNKFGKEIGINIPIFVKKWKSGERITKQEFFDKQGRKYYMTRYGELNLDEESKIKTPPNDFLEGGSKFSENFRTDEFKKDFKKEPVDETTKLGEEIKNFLRNDELISKQEKRSEILSEIKNYHEEFYNLIEKSIYFIENFRGVQDFRYELEKNKKFKDLVYKSCELNIKETVYRKYVTSKNIQFKKGSTVNIGDQCCSFSTDLKFVEKYNEDEIDKNKEQSVVFILKQPKKSLNFTKINEWESEILVMNEKGFKVKKVTEKNGIKYVEIEE